MSLAAAVKNALPFCVVVAVYAAFQRRRGAREIASALGLAAGESRWYVRALLAAVPFCVLVVVIAPWTSGFKGSMTAPFVGVDPTAEIIGRGLCYGFVATGFPEELLFRGLIAGALFRRMTFWKANVLQAFIFTMPHLLIILIAPSLWPLAILLPMALGLTTGWCRGRSGSIWPGVILHALPNLTGALAVMNWKF